MNVKLYQQFNRDGYFLASGLLRHKHFNLGDLTQKLTAEAQQRAGHSLRHATQILPELKALLRHPALLDLASQALAAEATPVKSIFFDKIPGKNWKVPRHQDLTIAVREQIDIEGFGPWSKKEGVPHVQPPPEFMTRIVALRIHLDDCNEHCGALRVVPGSHRHGRLSAQQIRELAGENGDNEIICAAKSGDVLAMSPLVIHASSPAQNPSHRRVLHVEYSAIGLPHGLDWYERI